MEEAGGWSSSLSIFGTLSSTRSSLTLLSGPQLEPPPSPSHTSQDPPDSMSMLVQIPSYFSCPVPFPPVARARCLSSCLPLSILASPHREISMQWGGERACFNGFLFPQPLPSAGKRLTALPNGGPEVLGFAFQIYMGRERPTPRLNARA